MWFRPHSLINSTPHTRAHAINDASLQSVDTQKYLAITLILLI